MSDPENADGTARSNTNANEKNANEKSVSDAKTSDGVASAGKARRGRRRRRSRGAVTAKNATDTDAPKRKRKRNRPRRKKAVEQPATAAVTPKVEPKRTGRTPTATTDPSKEAALETSAGGIVYRVHNGEALFLLIRDSYRNWGFPKGHLEAGELPADAAVREVREETGIDELRLDGAIETIDWFFRFRGKLVHKVCHFYLMRTEHAHTVPQREEGITACRWAPFAEATRLISYANARSVLSRAHTMVSETAS